MVALCSMTPNPTRLCDSPRWNRRIRSEPGAGPRASPCMLTSPMFDSNADAVLPFDWLSAIAPNMKSRETYRLSSSSSVTSFMFSLHALRFISSRSPFWDARAISHSLSTGLNGCSSQVALGGKLCEVVKPSTKHPSWSRYSEGSITRLPTSTACWTTTFRHSPLRPHSSSTAIVSAPHIAPVTVVPFALAFSRTLATRSGGRVCRRVRERLRSAAGALEILGGSSGPVDARLFPIRPASTGSLPRSGPSTQPIPSRSSRHGVSGTSLASTSSPPLYRATIRESSFAAESPSSTACDIETPSAVGWPPSTSLASQTRYGSRPAPASASASPAPGQGEDSSPSKIWDSVSFPPASIGRTTAGVAVGTKANDGSARIAHRSSACSSWAAATAA
mmetsp:Transcript_1235/g.2866  ORF Transcript_1235/g.2866 Transcript_1235/m.2866 type:complete len:391 (+) Transcript_1235:258-1430(+)